MFIGIRWAGLKHTVLAVALFRSHPTVLRQASRGPAGGMLAALDLFGSTAEVSLAKQPRPSNAEVDGNGNATLWCMGVNPSAPMMM